MRQVVSNEPQVVEHFVEIVSTALKNHPQPSLLYYPPTLLLNQQPNTAVTLPPSPSLSCATSPLSLRQKLLISASLLSACFLAKKVVSLLSLSTALLSLFFLPSFLEFGSLLSFTVFFSYFFVAFITVLSFFCSFPLLI